MNTKVRQKMHETWLRVLQFSGGFHYLCSVSCRVVTYCDRLSISRLDHKMEVRFLTILSIDTGHVPSHKQTQ